MRAFRTALEAGAAGTLAVSAFARLERLLLGRAPVYAPSRMAARLLRKLTGRKPSCEVRETAATLMRWTYGPGLGLAFGLARPSMPRGALGRAALFGLALFGFELGALPRVGATPRARRWSRAEVALLLAHSLAYGIVAELAFQRLSARQPFRPKLAPGFYERERPPLRPELDRPDVRG
ncbi:MAG: hypothetical protein ACOX6T_02410 [Myxococcales bacterium]|jgi:hypothetical protein